MLSKTVVIQRFMDQLKKDEDKDCIQICLRWAGHRVDGYITTIWPIS